MKFTDEQKHKIVTANGFNCSKGYCMNYEIPEESELINVFITEEEWDKKSKEGAKNYYWNKHTEFICDLDEAFEYCMEDIWDTTNYETEKEFNEYVFDKWCKQ